MTIRAGDGPPTDAGQARAGAEEASLLRELGSLREVDPPPALVARVMTGLATAAPPSLWQWLRRPIRIELALSPLAAVLLGVGLAAGGAAIGWRAQRPGPPPLSSEVRAAPTTVRVRFTYRAPGAHKVAVAGSFNGWSPEALLLEEAGADGLFVGSAPLPAGLHEYMFVVDGQWVTDPDSPLRRPDGFGRQNSLLRI
jgi:Glycogen recognition site of AMP-activated protein kinase